MELTMQSLSYFSVLLALFLAIPGFNTGKDLPRALKPINVIFDLNGVLLGTSKFTAFRQLGMGACAKYMLHMRQSPKHIQATLYDILDRIQPEGNLCNAVDPDGNLLPGLMCDWMNGNKSPQEILNLIKNEVKNHPEWFACKAEKQLVMNLATMMFTPRKMAKNVIVHKEGFAFARECKKKGYGVYILSNYDIESVEHIIKQNKKAFDIFNGILISSETGYIKPQSEIYQIYTDLLDPASCVFIDDQIKNVEMACTIGMNGIQCTPKKNGSPNWKRTRNLFAQLENDILGSQESVVLEA